MMSEIVNDLLLLCCYLLFLKHGIQKFQRRGPDPSLPRAREALSLFARKAPESARNIPRCRPV